MAKVGYLRLILFLFAFIGGCTFKLVGGEEWSINDVSWFDKREAQRDSGAMQSYAEQAEFFFKE